MELVSFLKHAVLVPHDWISHDPCAPNREVQSIRTVFLNHVKYAVLSLL